MLAHMKLRPPLTATWEWTTVIPEDHPMAPFTNGAVAAAKTHGPLQFKTGTLYRRRVLSWRGRWRTAETGGGVE
jgi:hypothetical protein